MTDKRQRLGDLVEDTICDLFKLPAAAQRKVVSPSMDMTACPSNDRLIVLIDGALSADEAAAIQSHVDGCDRCQKTLEKLVAGSASWDAAVNHLRHEIEPVHETILAAAMDEMKSDPHVSVSPSASRPSDPLDFLSASDHPGSIGKLGSYEVSEVIGQGGMGVVLKAFDPSLHRVVAVKVLAPYLAHNPQARKRFIREAKAIAAVSHDHVITIHAIDESIEQPKIVMQYIPGQSLQQKLDVEGSLELKEILRIGMQTAAGLAAAHAQGLVHRDIKPSNILLENSIQRVKLTDFGLARAVDDASITQSGVIAGTPQYMAPEQANGDAVDRRADLFSLGSVMYAMCVGHSPFRASTTMGVLKRVCHDPPRPIRELNADIPEWLCDIIMKLLEKKPEDRFSTARSVAELLEQWLAYVQQPQIAPIPSTKYSLGRGKSSPLVAFQPPIAPPVPESVGSEGSSVDETIEAERLETQRKFRRGTWVILCLSILVGIVMSLISKGFGARASGPLQNATVGFLLGLIAFVPIWTVRYFYALLCGFYSDPHRINRGLNPADFRRTTILSCLLTVICSPILAVGLYSTKISWLAGTSAMNSGLVGLCSGLGACIGIALIRYFQFRNYEKAAKWQEHRSGKKVVEETTAREGHATSRDSHGETSRSGFRSPVMQFKPLSWRWLVICLLVGGLFGSVVALMRGIVPAPIAGQEPVEAIIVGLALGFGAFLLVTLFRLALVEIREALFFAAESPTFPIGPILKEKSVQIAAWTKRTARFVSTIAQQFTRDLIYVFTKSFQAEGRRELKQATIDFAQTYSQRLRDGSRSSMALWLTIGWNLAGVVDLLWLISSLGKYIVWDAFGLAITMISAVIAYNIHIGENPELVRKLALVGLWPFSVGAIFRIPLAVVTWVWLRVPTVQRSFSQVAWPETKLGRPITTYIQPLVRFTHRVGTRSIVTIGSLLLWTTFCYGILYLLFLVEVAPTWSSTYWINDSSIVTLREDPSARFAMLVRGTGETKGLMPPASSCPRREIVFGLQEEDFSRSLRVSLGEVPVNMTTGSELTMTDIESFFLTLFGKSHTVEALSLFRSIRSLNDNDGRNRNSNPSPDRWNYIRRVISPTKTGQSIPLTGYSRAGAVLEPRVFDSVPDFKRSRFGCILSPISFTKGVTFAIVFWLTGVTAIVLFRRHQRVSTASSN